MSGQCGCSVGGTSDAYLQLSLELESLECSDTFLSSKSGRDCLGPLMFIGLSWYGGGKIEELGGALA